MLTAAADLLGPCLDPGGSQEGTFEAVCEAAGGTAWKSCEPCYLVFQCCIWICTAS